MYNWLDTFIINYLFMYNWLDTFICIISCSCLFGSLGVLCSWNEEHFPLDIIWCKFIM